MCEEYRAKIDRYLRNARPWFENLRIEKSDIMDVNKISKQFYDIAISYYKDALYFYKKNEYANSLAALEYAEGWLDAGCAIGIFRKYNKNKNR